MATLEELKAEALRISNVSNPSHVRQNEWFGDLMLDMLQEEDLFGRSSERYQLQSDITFVDGSPIISGSESDVNDPASGVLVTNSDDIELTFNSVVTFDYLEIIYRIDGNGSGLALTIEDDAGSNNFSATLADLYRTNGALATYKIPFDQLSNDLTLNNNINIKLAGSTGIEKGFKFVGLVTRLT